MIVYKTMCIIDIRIARQTSQASKQKRLQEVPARTQAAHPINRSTNMISIREDQIKGIVEDLQEYGFLECHRVPAHVVHSAVCKWLESHIHSLTEDAVWWFTKGKDLRDCGLPYEDEIQEYQEEGDRALTVGDKF